MAIETGVPHGRFATVCLADDRLRLELAPSVGAKVVSLMDVASGREWLTQGDPPAWADQTEAIFGAEVAYGWDECVPTVSPSPDPVLGGPPLRDHGDAWGRPTRVDVSGGLLDAAWDGLRWPYHLRRRLQLSGPGGAPGVVAAYELQNRGSQPLPFIWSMHPLLALEPGSTIHLAGIDGGLTLGQATGVDLGEAGDQLTWPEARLADGSPFRLDEVRRADARQAVKLYGQPAIGRAAASTRGGDWLGLAWDLDVAPYVGLWLDFGGWPAGRPIHQVAIEPTTAPADELGAAIATGNALELAPRERRTWAVQLELGQGPESLAAFLAGGQGSAG